MPGDYGRARYLFTESSERARGGEQLLASSQEHGVILRSRLGFEVWNPSDDVSLYKVADIGDFVISLRSFEGGLEVVRDKGILSPAYTVLRPRRPKLTPFYRWYFKSRPFIATIGARASGIRQGKSVQWADIRDLAIPTPDDARAEVVGNFLDRECARIHELQAELHGIVGIAETEASLRRDADLDHHAREWGRVKLGRRLSVLSGFAFASERFAHSGACQAG